MKPAKGTSAGQPSSSTSRVASASRSAKLVRHERTGNSIKRDLVERDDSRAVSGFAPADGRLAPPRLAIKRRAIRFPCHEMSRPALNYYYYHYHCPRVRRYLSGLRLLSFSDVARPLAPHPPFSTGREGKFEGEVGKGEARRD